MDFGEHFQWGGLGRTPWAVLPEHPADQWSGLGGALFWAGVTVFCRAYTRLLVTSTSARTDKLLDVLALLLICGDCVLARFFRFGNSGVIVASHIASDSQSQYPSAQDIRMF